MRRAELDWFDRTGHSLTGRLCLLAALENEKRAGNAPVFLTKLGGGAFGNDTTWIRDAMSRALDLAGDWGLDVRVVHFGEVDESFGSVTSR